MRFGKLIVLRQSENPRDKWYNKNLICQCDCGKISEVSYSNLIRGHTKSCGCFRDEVRGNSLKKCNTYDLSGSYGIGYLINGSCFYFDLEDYDKIKSFYWVLHNCGYACHQSKKNKKNTRLYMHRIIMNQEDKNICVDHINHNKLDNRKSNLRIATIKENTYNQAISARNTSGIIGVSFIAPKGIWESQISKDKTKYYLGKFLDKEMAIKVRLEAENTLYGEFAPQKHLFKQYKIGE